MAHDRPPTLPDATDAVDEEPDVEDLKIIVQQHEDGSQSLDLREPEFEQQYTLEDAFRRAVFIVLCRQVGAKMYRRPRQRQSTICVRTTLSAHDQLWSRYLALAPQLEARLVRETLQFIHEHLEPDAATP